MRLFKTYILLLVAGCSLEPEPELDGASAVRSLVNHGTLADTLLPEKLPEDGGAYRYTGAMFIGTDLWRVPVEVRPPNVTCLDGSEPVMYVSAAPAGSPHEDEWVLFIPGGGSVERVDEAVAIWFGEGRSASFDEMSTRWAPPSIGGRGIFRPVAVDNPFAGFNKVFIHKCSYDRFMGRTDSTQTLLQDHMVDGYTPGVPSQIGMTLAAGDQIDLSFRGHEIVEAAVDTLASSTVVYDDGSGPTTMPSMADAETVLFVGHSGGSKGGTMIIDDVTRRIRDHAASADVRFVMDGGFYPGAESVVNGATYPATSYPVSDPANVGFPLSKYGAMKASFEQDWGAALDATCLANEVDDAVCGDTIHVLLNWVETPFFIRQDLFDENHRNGHDADGDVVPDCWQTDWDPDRDICYGDTFDLATAMVDQVADLAQLRTQALTHTVLGTPLLRSTGFFPACGYHIGAHTNDGFHSTLTTAAGQRGSYAEALWRWYQQPNVGLRLVEATTPIATPNACPP
jgi:hypothetical protein